MDLLPDPGNGSSLHFSTVTHWVHLHMQLEEHNKLRSTLIPRTRLLGIASTCASGTERRPELAAELGGGGGEKSALGFWCGGVGQRLEHKSAEIAEPYGWTAGRSPASCWLG